MSNKNTDEVFDTVTYGEKRTIGIGDFESVSSFLSFSRNVKVVKDDVLVTIEKEGSVTVKKSNHVKEAKKLIKKVRKVLDSEETKIRKWSDQFTTFETTDKLPENREW